MEQDQGCMADTQETGSHFLLKNTFVFEAKYAEAFHGKN